MEIFNLPVDVLKQINTMQHREAQQQAAVWQLWRCAQAEPVTRSACFWRRLGQRFGQWSKPHSVQTA